MNACRKGKRGEREFASVLRAAGFADARRGQQFSGSPESPDVICDSLAGFHFEIKRVERLNIASACEQAERDARGKPYVIAHRRNKSLWHVTVRVETFLALLHEHVNNDSKRPNCSSAKNEENAIHDNEINDFKGVEATKSTVT